MGMQGGAPRQLFGANTPGANAGLGGNAPVQNPFGGMGSMLPAIFQSMQQGNPNAMFGSALGGMMGGGGGPSNHMMPSGPSNHMMPSAPPGGGFRPTPPPAFGQRSFNPGPNVPYIPPPAPIQRAPNGVPMQPGNPGQAPSRPTPITTAPRPPAGGQPSRPNVPVNAERVQQINALQQQLANPDQSSPFALLMARRRLAELGG